MRKTELVSPAATLWGILGMRTITSAATAVLVCLVLAPGLSHAGSSMSGTWKAKQSGGALHVRVAGGKAQMRLVGSCSNAWLDLKPADAFVLKAGQLSLNKNQFSVFIGGACSTAKVRAKKAGNGYRFTFQNQWRFTGQVK